jgi:hypothetical protein
MNETETQSNLATEPRVVGVLAELRLSAEELAALARQGFVSREHRGSRGPYFKLRYRVAGEQKVRCLGTCSDRAEQIARALLDLQAQRREEKDDARLLRRGRRHLRASTAAVTWIAEANGYHFHGHALRRKSKGHTPDAATYRMKPLTTERTPTMPTTNDNSQPIDSNVPAAAGSPDQSIEDRRRSKIEEFLRQSLDDESLEVATLGATTAGLMQIAVELEERVLSFFASTSDAPDEVHRILPTVDMRHRYARLQERFHRLLREVKRR